MKKALVHEWFVDYAGSERCIESFVNIWNDFDLYSLVSFPDAEIKKKVLKEKQVNTSFIQKLPFAEKKFRNYLSLFPLAVEQFDLTGYDVVLSSSHAVAKGALTNQNQLHICYCHTPIRYAWDLHYEYLRNSGLDKGLKGFMAKRILHRIRQWDVISANRVDHFIANSKYIAGRIKKTYNRDADVIYPPVDTHLYPLETNKEDYYFTASRFVPYKKVELIVEAFSQMPDKKLLVAGDGTNRKLVESKAGKNIELLGYLPTEKLNEYMKKAKAFVFAAEEDFGITVVEALSCGTPVIALNKGGTAETVIDGFNGVHFGEQTVSSITDAVKRFETVKAFDYQKINEFAGQFSREIFEKKIKSFVEEKYERFTNK
jgi:glycosyltransferase involved in cell wall biosynthesis